MNDSNQKCKTCDKPLKPSQYAKKKKEGENAVMYEEDFVCCNPDCPVAEKQIDNK